MKSQKDEFKASEADQWFERNKAYYEKTKNEDERMVEAFKKIEIHPKSVLEIGCSTGIKLQKVYENFGSNCWGIDPSGKAIAQGQQEYPSIHLQIGTAEELPFKDKQFDMVILGFCLYLCDRSDLFKIAYETDRCLTDNGYLVLLDFYPPFPYKNTYTHKEGLFSYKMDYTKMFTWNPDYTKIYNDVFSHSGYKLREIPNEKVALTILNKKTAFAYPTNPFG